MSSSSSLATASGAPKQDFRFIARQPILNREQQVFGYELLFRDGIENFFHAADLEAAARHTLDSTLLMGFDLVRRTAGFHQPHARASPQGRYYIAAFQTDGGRGAGERRPGRPGDGGLASV